MKKIFPFLVVALLLFTLPASADKMTVTLMISHKNMPLAGAKVYVNDVFRGVTNEEGQFSFGTAYFHGKAVQETLKFKTKVETSWLSYETTIEVLEGDARTVIIIYVPWRKT